MSTNNCVNDDSVQDTEGDTCSSWYNDNPSDCKNTKFYTENFNASKLCCVCGGGTSPSGNLNF